MRFDALPPVAVHPGFRWSAPTQRRFVEVLAECGSVRVAAASVSKTHRAAYQLRGRPDGRWFGVGWDAAIGIARDYMADRMMEAAMGPIEYVGVREGGSGRLSWRRTDPTLARGRGMALLRRLDKAAANIAAEPARCRLAYQAQGDFLVFLALLGRGAADNEYRAFFAQAQSPENDVLYGYLHGFPAFSGTAKSEVPDLMPKLSGLGLVPGFGPAAGADLKI